MLLHDRCQPLTIDQDGVLPSKVGYLVTLENGEVQLWWALDHLYDKFRSCGENRALFKWILWFRHGVTETEYTNGLFIHTKRQDLPQDALRENIASTVAVISFLAFIQKESRTQQIIDYVRGWMPQIASRACSILTSARSIPIEEMLPLTISPGGVVRGLEESLSNRHRTVFVVVQKAWNAMYESGEVSEQLISGENLANSLQDLVYFLFSIEKKRKENGQHMWPRSSAVGSTLWKLQKAIVSFLAVGVDVFTRGWYMLEHDCSTVPPSRRGSGGSSQELQSAKKVRMTPDAIYELLESARKRTVNVRAGLGLLERTRLSTVAGCKANAVDAWVRRSQSIYDHRAALAFQGVMHFNLAADASTHAGKELLVSILWSHQCNSAAFANNQVILPLAQIAPGELELTSLVEHLAQDCQIKSVLTSFFGIEMVHNVGSGGNTTVHVDTLRWGCLWFDCSGEQVGPGCKLSSTPGYEPSAFAPHQRQNCKP